MEREGFPISLHNHREHIYQRIICISISCHGQFLREKKTELAIESRFVD